MMQDEVLGEKIFCFVHVNLTHKVQSEEQSTTLTYYHPSTHPQ